MKNASSRNLLRTALLAVIMCALPALAGDDVFGLGDGRDGALNVGGNTIVNRYAKVTGPLAPGDTVISIQPVMGPAPTPAWSVAPGDVVMVIQTTGIVPEPPSDGAPSVDLSGDPVGRWELARISSSTGTSVTLDAPLLYSYAAGVTQLVRVAQYTSVTVGTASLLSKSWDGSTGGIVAFLSQGPVSITGTISAQLRGFRGGMGVRDTSAATACTGMDEPGPRGAQKGEGIAVTRYGSSATGRGRVANGAGGGVCVKSGGGGGGNAGAGGQGGYSMDGSRQVGGQGGASLTYPAVTRLTFGGGGGPGHIQGLASQTGGAGGGIVFMRGGSLSGSGFILADGTVITTSSTEGAAGGGAGGTIYMRFSGTADCFTSRVRAQGGKGGDTSDMTGPGGGGGGGRVIFQACGGGICNLPTSAVAGGAAGISSVTFDNYGAEPGGDGVLTVIPGCYSPLSTPVVVTPANGTRTNNPRPVYSGTLFAPYPAGTEIVIYVDGTQVGITTPDAAGNWSFTQPTNLLEGNHTVHAIARNLTQGLQSSPSNTNAFVVDFTPPAPPVVVTPPNNSTTSNNKPVYSGTAEPNSTVTVYVDGNPVGTPVLVDAAGNWALPQPTALPDGPHTVAATATDAAGNTSPQSSINNFTVDTTKPAPPILVAPPDGSVINNNKPVYSGTAEPNSTVTVYVDGNLVGTATANASGAWSFTQPTALPDGNHSVKATATDLVGNTSGDSNTNTFTVDTAPPAKPVVVTPANGSITNNNQPVYSGTAEPNSTVTVYVDGNPVGSVTADPSGAWSLTQPTALPDGNHTVTATAADAAGNMSAQANTNTFTVDATPPAKPVVVTPANGSKISNNQPVYTGTAEPNSTVAVIVDGNLVGNATANASGAWSFPQPTALTDGNHMVKARATDVAGNISPESDTNTFEVDTTPPQPPVVQVPADGSVINTNQPTYSGTAEPNSIVTVIVDGSPVGTATANASGAWSFQQPTALTDGSHSVKATATDSVGNTSQESSTNTFRVDTTPPAKPVVQVPADGSVINTNLPVYSGTAEPNSTVTVIVDGTPLGTAMANASGAWSFTPVVPLADGPHAVKATATDSVGNTSLESDTNAFMVDTIPPAKPVVQVPANGSKISNNQPTYSGTAEPNSTVMVYVDGNLVGNATANASGAWSFPQPTALTDGNHTVKATATDGVGNTSVESDTNTFEVDTTPPLPPVVQVPADGSVINTNQPTYSGTAEPNSIVTVIVDGSPVGTVTANASGAWSFQQPTALTDGSHSVKATARDAAGTTSQESAANTFKVDTSGPAAPVVQTPADGSTTGDNTPTYSGTAEPNSTVTVYVDGAVAGSATANATGTWSLTLATALADGSHTVKATATDAAGNTSADSATNTFTVDTTPPARPAVVTPANGSLTNNNQPAYSGTAEPNSTVTVYVDGAVVGTATANASGAWSFPQPTALADGNHMVKATATDGVGNVSPESDTNTFTVDTTPPARPVVVTPADGSTTSDNTPTYSGTAEPNSTVTVYVDGSSVGTVTASATGTWSLTPATALADGSHSVKATATDAAGNISQESTANTFTVDTTAPAAPIIATPVDGSTIPDNTPTYSGTAEPNSTVTVIVDGAVAGTTTASATGTWSFTPTVGLPNGPHTVTATATDAVGNISPESAPNAFTVDATIPATPVVLTPANNSVTNDSTPAFTGTAEANTTVTIFLGTTELGTTTTSASGSWSFTPTTPLAEGSYDVSAVATNAVGNTSERSKSNHFTIDTTPPGAPVVTSPANDSVTNDNTPTITGTAEPNSTVTVMLNDNATGTTTASASGAWSFTPSTPLPDGAYIVVATATDAAGNTSAPSTDVRFAVDTAAPETNIVSGPSGEIQDPDAAFDFSSTESGGSYECKLDNADFVPCSDHVTFADLAEGEHTLQVRARDIAGNVDPTPAVATWTYHPPPSDWALLGNGVGCAATGGDPSALAMMALGVLSVLMARKRQR